MPEAWPGGLPEFNAVGRVSAVLPVYTRRSQMDAGAAKVRRVATGMPRPQTVGHPALTQAQIGALQTFFEATLEGGALTFTYADPVSGADKTARAVEPPRLVALGAGLWSVTWAIEVLT